MPESATTHEYTRRDARDLAEVEGDNGRRERLPRADTPPPSGDARSWDATFAPDQPEAWPGVRYVHNQVEAQLMAQCDAWHLVDARLRLILGVAGVVFAAVLGLQPAARPAMPLVGMLTIGACAFFLLAAVIAFVGGWPAKLDRPPAPSRLRGAVGTDPRQIQLAVIDEMTTAFGRNEGKLDGRLRALKMASVCMAAATVLLGAALITLVAAQTPALHLDLGAMLPARPDLPIKLQR